jgi:hypothetical protein
MMSENLLAKKERIFFKKIKTDRPWYFKNFLRIRNKKAQIVPFEINPSQQIVMDKIEECERNGVLKRFIVLKARQMGLSTLFEGIIFHDTANNELKNSLIIAHEESASSNLFNMSKLFYECLPDVIRPMKKYSNGRILSFENPTNDDDEKRKTPGLRSKITIATAGSGEVGRSSTVHNLHASELAFFPDGKTTMLGLLQAVPDEMNTFVVLESTANGLGDYFHTMWQQAVRGESGFIPIFLPWFIDPGYKKPFISNEEYVQFISEVNATSRDDKGNKVHSYEYLLMNRFNLSYEQLNWRRHTIRTKCQGDEILFMQEYPATPEEAFISTGRPKFNIKSLQRYSTAVRPPKRTGYLTSKQSNGILFLDEEKGYISIWEEPIPGRYYCIGFDVAEGLAHGDYSAGVVVDSTSLDIVAKWHGHIDPDLLGEEAVKLAKYYNEAYLGVENNNHGLTTLKAIQRLEYWNIFFTKTYDKIADKITKKMGWTTSTRTKPLAIDKLAEYVRECYLGIYDEVLITELSTYVIDDRGATNAQEGSYDDLVMALAIALQLVLEGMGENYTPEDSDDFKTPNIIDKTFESNSAGAIEVAE